MKNFKVGDKVKPSGKLEGSSNPYLNVCTYPSMIFTITADTTGSSSMCLKKGGRYNIKNDTGMSCGYIYGNEMELFIKNKKQIEESINELENQITELKDKLSFMNDNNLEEYDENVFKSYSVLKLLDNKKLTSIEKAKLIAELINQ